MLLYFATFFPIVAYCFGGVESGVDVVVVGVGVVVLAAVVLMMFVVVMLFILLILYLMFCFILQRDLGRPSPSPGPLVETEPLRAKRDSCRSLICCSVRQEIPPLY